MEKKMKWHEMILHKKHVFFFLHQTENVRTGCGYWSMKQTD